CCCSSDQLSGGAARLLGRGRVPGWLSTPEPDQPGRRRNQLMRRILGGASIEVAAASMLIGLAAGPAHASDDCENQTAGTYVVYRFNTDDGTTHVWAFECNGDGTARFVGGG